jgi:hypothetical protein
MGLAVITAGTSRYSMRLTGCFLVSAGIYRNQNLVPPQEPRGKRGVVPGPYGIAYNGKAPFVNPRLQLQLVSKVALLAPETEAAAASRDERSAANR